MKAYKVKVKTTAHKEDCFWAVNTEGEEESLDCQNGYITVVTDHPGDIFDSFNDASGETVVEAIELIGPGYCLDET